MSEIHRKHEDLDSSGTDRLVSAAKGLLGAVPVAGSLLSEIAGSIIPNQRLDRLAGFAKALDQRIQGIEETLLDQAKKSEEFTDFVEEALRQASRSISEERREYLASIVANGLTDEVLTFEDSKYLLKLMGELSDVEVIWLRSYQVPAIGEDEEFRAKHESVLKVVPPVIGSPREVVEKAAIQGKYTKHLVDLGLVSAEIDKNMDGKPEFDRFTGNFRISYHRTSTLGDLLLRMIGISVR